MATPRVDVDLLESQLKRVRDRLEVARSVCPLLKIWTLTWNLGAAEPFGAVKGKAPKFLGQFVPSGYDLYVVGVQEGISDEVFDAFEQRLNMQEGISRVDLAGFAANQAAAAAAAAAGSSGGAADNGSGGGSGGARPDYIYGRGDGSMLHPKFTGIALFARDSLLRNGRVKLLRVAHQSTALMTSKGGAACCLSLDGQTVAFISCHLEAGNKFEERRSQYREVSFGLGGKLGEEGFDLGTQLHHIVWMGDMNYRCVQGAGRGERDKAMDGDRCVGLLENGRHQILFKNHDQLSIEIGRREVFYEYQEPSMAPDFYPTYKKFEHRPPTNYLDKGWVRRTYHVHFREPIYKGGRVKDRTPGWCDRVLFHSLHDVREELKPERVLLAALPTSGDAGSACVKAPVLNHDTGELVDEHTTLGDHYYAVNDGHGMSVSDHSPVVAAFTFLANWRQSRSGASDGSCSNGGGGDNGGGSGGGVATTFLPHTNEDDEGEEEGSASLGSAAFRGRAWDMHSAQVASLADTAATAVDTASSSGSSSSLAAVSTTSTTAAAAAAAAGEGGEGTAAVTDRHGSFAATGLGQCRVRLDGLELMVGTSTVVPASLKVLFPLPFEAAWFSPPSDSTGAAAGNGGDPVASSVEVYADSEIAVALPRNGSSNVSAAEAANGRAPSSTAAAAAGVFWSSSSSSSSSNPTASAGGGAPITASGGGGGGGKASYGVRGLFKSSGQTNRSNSNSTDPQRINSTPPEASSSFGAYGAEAAQASAHAANGAAASDVMWASTPNATGGVTCTVEVPDPELFEVISIGQLHSAQVDEDDPGPRDSSNGRTSSASVSSGASAGSSISRGSSSSRHGQSTNAKSASSMGKTATMVPWLQLEYEGPRGVEELHVAIQAHLRGGSGSSGAVGANSSSCEFGHCVVGLSQLFAERSRRRRERKANHKRLAQQRQQHRQEQQRQRDERGVGADGGGGGGGAAAAVADEEEEEAAAEKELAKEEELERRGLVKSRFVKPLMFRGLPLLALDPSSGEHEVVTAVFELSLHQDPPPPPPPPSPPTTAAAATVLPPPPPPPQPESQSSRTTSGALTSSSPPSSSSSQAVVNESAATSSIATADTGTTGMGSSKEEKGSGGAPKEVAVGSLSDEESEDEDDIAKL